MNHGKRFHTILIIHDAPQGFSRTKIFYLWHLSNFHSLWWQLRNMWHASQKAMIYILFLHLHILPSSCTSWTCPLSTQSKFKTTAACENYTTSKTSLNTLQHCLGFVCAMNVAQFTSTVLPITGMNVMCSCLKSSRIFFFSAELLLQIQSVCLVPRWIESWQCQQMSHSPLVRPVLLWREKVSSLGYLHSLDGFYWGSLLCYKLLDSDRGFLNQMLTADSQTDTYPCDFCLLFHSAGLTA